MLVNAQNGLKPTYERHTMMPVLARYFLYGDFGIGYLILSDYARLCESPVASGTNVGDVIPGIPKLCGG